MKKPIPIYVNSPALYFKGGSIAYTLMISLMVSGLFSAFWLMQSHHQQFMSKVFGEERAMTNLASGLNLFCISENKASTFWASSLFENSVDSTQIETAPWGLFRLALCKGKNGMHTAQKAALLGQAPRGHFARSLFLADHHQPLCLVGDTYLGGEIYLPGAGYKTGTVLGKGFVGKMLPTGPVRSSFLQKVKTYIPQLTALCKQLSFPTSPVLTTYSLRDWKIRSPWNSPAFQQSIGGNLYLEKCEVSGKNILRATQTITIDSSAKLDMPLLFGRDIYVKSGFNGRIQAFASHSIKIDSGVVLAYPSVLMLLSQGGKEAHITVGENCKIAGGIGVELKGEEPETYVKISQGALITGHLWGIQNLELQGTVHGSVITERFTLQTAGGQFQSYLLDASIDVHQLPEGYAMPIIQEEPVLRRVCWLGEEGE